MYIKKPYLVPLLAAGFVAMLTGPASAQPFKTLHNFGASPSASGGLIIAGDTLYGTGDGSVFAIKTSGTVFTILHTFTPRIADGSGFFRNMDGAVPQAPLVLSGNLLYGATSEGGQWGNGVVFAVRTDGTKPNQARSSRITPVNTG